LAVNPIGDLTLQLGHVLAQFAGEAGGEAGRSQVLLHAGELLALLPQLACVLGLDGLVITLEKSLFETVRGSQASPCEP
jgi:hypothetical protein